MEAHDATHEPHQSWFPACVAGRGRVFAHHTVDHSSDTYSGIAIDYAYLSGRYQDDEEVEDE
eukprot:6073477-Karenia_brevis.AAC.1